MRKKLTDKKVKESPEYEKDNPRTPQGAKGRNVRTRKRKPASDRSSAGTSTHFNSTNDVAWYARNEQLLRDVGKFSFNNPVGTNFSKLVFKNSGFHKPLLEVHSPGIFSVNIIPAYGINGTAFDALNLAATQIYNKLRGENSGGKNYDPNDYMMYLIAMDQMFTWYAYLMRAYGIMSHYTFFNKYTPRYLVETMGFDYNDLNGKFSDFRRLINTIALKMSAFCVPRGMPIFERHARMFGNVYKDADHTKAQYYMYNCAYIGYYDPTYSQTGGGIQWEPVTQKNQRFGNESGWNKLGLSDIENITNLILGGANDEDFVIMSGDTLKAWGYDGIWKQSMIDEQFALEPIFDFTWLTQIQNMSSLDMDHNVLECPYVIEQVIPTPPASPYISTVCDTTIVTAGGHTSPLPAGGHNSLLLSPFTDPTEGDVMESTRLLMDIEPKFVTSNSNPSYSNKWACKVLSCGSEIVVNQDITAIMTRYNASGVPQQVDAWRYQVYVNQCEKDTASWSDVVRRFGLIDAFAMHPTIYPFGYVQGTSSAITDFTHYTPFADLDNFTVLDGGEIAKLHETAILSELFVENAGRLDPKIQD